MLAKIYVPTENEKILRDLAERFSKYFGGCTIIPNCKGFWINGENKLIEDKITIIESYFENSAITEDQAKVFLVNTADFIKRRLKQDSVAFVLDNSIYFL